MSVLTIKTVKLNAKAGTKAEAIRIAGQLLVDAGYAAPEYVEQMLERERLASTYMGGGLAIPHGTKEAGQWIRSTGLSIVQFPQGVDFGDGNTAYLLVGIAAAGDEHLELLTNVAVVCSDETTMQHILDVATPEQMIAIFAERNEE